jgi:hypothetical protein
MLLEFSDRIVDEAISLSLCEFSFLSFGGGARVMLGFCLGRHCCEVCHVIRSVNSVFRAGLSAARARHSKFLRTAIAKTF